MVTDRWVRFAFGLVALTGVLLVFGSTVRVHGAGLACPDWPLCFGQVVPDIDFRVSLEWGHRVLASVVSFGFLAHGVWAWRSGVLSRSEGFRRLYVLAAVTLVTQVILGGLTVWQLLAEWTVASHLIAGNTFCALLLLLALTLVELRDPAERPAIDARVRALPLLLALLVPAQLILGGLVAGSHAGLACGTWPSCNGAGWFPTFEGLVGLQVTHRIVAYLLLTLAWVNAAVQRGSTRRPALLIAALVTVQALIGIANVLTRLPVEVTLLHSAGAASVYAATAWSLFEALSSPVAASAVVGGRISNASVGGHERA